MLTSRPEWLRALILVPAWAAVALGVAGLIGNYVIPGHTRENAFLPPVLALGVMLCGLLLLIGRYTPRYTAALGLASLLLLGTIHSLGWFGALPSGGDVSMQMLASLLVLCGAGASVWLGRTPSMVPVRDLSSMWLAMVGVFLTVSTSFAIMEREHTISLKYAEATADDAAVKLFNAASNIAALIQRMGERWSVIDGEIGQRLLEREFSTYLRDYTTIGKMSLMLEDGTELAFREELGFSEGWVSGPPAAERVRDWFVVEASGRAAQLSPFYRQRSDGYWGLVAVKAGRLGDQTRIIVGQVNVSGLFKLALSSGEPLAHFEVWEGDKLLYQTETAYRKQASPVVTRTLDFKQGTRLTLNSYLVSRDASVLGLAMESLPLIVLAVGFLFTMVMTASLRFAQIARYQSNELRTAAITDELTGLPNRKGAAKVLGNAMKRSRRDGSAIGVISLSVSGIDLIADSFGHRMGDALLQQVSSRIQGFVAGNGSVARHGDGNFIVLHNQSSRQALETFVRKLVDTLQRPFFISGNTLRLSAYAGSTLWAGEECDPLQLVRQADLAMIDSKYGGQYSWQSYDPEMDVRASQRIALQSDLQTAIDTWAFELHYQPIIDGQTGRVCSVEALLRWKHAERGWISPMSFLPLAEETGMIIPLTDGVLLAACSDARRMRDSGLGDFSVAVNISPSYFRHEDFVDRVEATLHSVSLEPSGLAIEITEGVLVENQEDTIVKLQALRERGIKTAIDDFGTGYSSLSYLKNLPVDKVKVDRSFITDGVTDRPGAAIMRGIISMVHHLNLKVVAEGVETDAQCVFLRQNFCDEFQGYLYCRPIAMDDLIKLLQQNNGRFSLPKSGRAGQA